MTRRLIYVISRNFPIKDWRIDADIGDVHIKLMTREQ